MAAISVFTKQILWELNSFRKESFYIHVKAFLHPWFNITAPIMTCWWLGFIWSNIHFVSNTRTELEIDKETCEISKLMRQIKRPRSPQRVFFFCFRQALAYPGEILVDIKVIFWHNGRLGTRTAAFENYANFFKLCYCISNNFKYTDPKEQHLNKTWRGISTCFTPFWK